MRTPGPPQAADALIERVSTRESFVWPARLAALLGQVPDHVVARRAGVTVGVVCAERRRRGIAASRQVRRVEWTPEMIALLGTDSDASVGAELGLPGGTVCSKRQRLGIPPCNPPHGRPAGFLWTPAALALLGTATDAAVARRLHLSKSQVNYQRVRRGIPAFRPGRPRIDWGTKMIELLGTRSDADLARHFGISVAAVREERWRRKIPAHGPPWGKVKRTAAIARLLRLPDREIMRRTGLSEPTVLSLRREYGIERPPRPSAWTREVLARLGKEPDTAIAADLGFHLLTVRAKRRSLGIAAAPSPRRWSERERALLDQLSVADFARLTGRSEGAVRQQRMLQRRRRSGRS